LKTIDQTNLDYIKLCSVNLVVINCVCKIHIPHNW